MVTCQSRAVTNSVNFESGRQPKTKEGHRWYDPCDAPFDQPGSKCWPTLLLDLYLFCLAPFCLREFQFQYPVLVVRIDFVRLHSSGHPETPVK
jgi:hypothetical protein